MTLGVQVTRIAQVQNNTEVTVAQSHTHIFRDSIPELLMSLSALPVLTVLDSFCSVPAFIEMHSKV